MTLDRTATLDQGRPTALQPPGLAVAGLAATAALYLTATPVFFLAILALLACIFALRPIAGVFATAAAVPLTYQPIAVSSSHVSPTEILIVATLAGFALSRALPLVGIGRPRLESDLVIARGALRDGFVLTGLLLLAVGALSLLTVADPSYRHESLREFRWVILEPVLLFLVARFSLESTKQSRQLALFFAAGAVFSCLWALTDLARGAGIDVEGVIRVRGPYPHPNALALFVERAAIFAAIAGLAFSARARWLWLGLSALFFAALVFTFSRGALLAAAVVALAGLLIGGRRRLALGAATGSIIFGLVLAFAARDRIGNLLHGGSGSLRIAIWRSSIEMIRDHPVFGVGLDQYLYQYVPRYVRPEAWAERFTSHPHDIVLDVWLRLGIMGLIAASSYGVVLVRRTRRSVALRSAWALAAIGVITASATHGLVDNGYFLPDLAVIFWLMTAVIDRETAEAAVST